MTATKQDIVNGIIKYAKTEVIGKIPDKALKMIVATAVSALEVNPDAIDTVLTHPFISSVVIEEDGKYKLDQAFKIIEKTMTDYGEFPVKIPPIRFISPEEKELTFSLVDIRKLEECILGGVVTNGLLSDAE